MWLNSVDQATPTSPTPCAPYRTWCFFQLLILTAVGFNWLQNIGSITLHVRPNQVSSSKVKLTRSFTVLHACMYVCTTCVQSVARQDTHTQSVGIGKRKQTVHITTQLICNWDYAVKDQTNTHTHTRRWVWRKSVGRSCCGYRMKNK